MSSSDRRQQILSLAQGIVADEGPGALTMARLASEAGVGKPVVYRLFANRDEVALAILESHWHLLEETFDEAMSLPGTVEERLRHAVAGYFSAFEERGVGVRALAALASDPTIELERLEWQRTVEQRWAGELRSAFGLTERAANLVVTAARGALDRVCDQWTLGDHDRGWLERAFVSMIVSMASSLAALDADHE